MIHEFPPLHDCWYLTGATASGKTHVGVRLAEAIGAEIISLDSMAVYRGMNIGTAKPTAEDIARVPHHALDIVSPNEDFSLAEYLAHVHQAVEEIGSRGKEVLFVGGTPLYLKSLVRGVCEGPAADPEFRRMVEQEVAEVGIDALRQRLQQIDPLSAAKLHPNDLRRMIRALEVHKLTGLPISHYQMQFDSVAPQHGTRVFALSWDRAQLHERINARVDRMYQRHFVDEVQGLIEQHGRLSTTALQGVGYREVIEYLDGKRNLESAIDQTKVRTRRFARRQETWFRGLEECIWLPIDERTSEVELVTQMQEHPN